MSLCVGIVGMCRYMQVLVWVPNTIPIDTDIYLQIVTYLHIVADTVCHYRVGIFL